MLSVFDRDSRHNGPDAGEHLAADLPGVVSSTPRIGHLCSGKRPADGIHQLTNSSHHSFARSRHVPNVSNLLSQLSPTSRRPRVSHVGCAAYVQAYARSPTLVSYQAAEFSCERRFLSALPPCCFRKYLATGLTNLKGVVGDHWDDGGIPMAKFFNHYHPDHAVGFGHPYSDRRPITWQYTLGYRGYD